MRSGSIAIIAGILIASSVLSVRIDGDVQSALDPLLVAPEHYRLEFENQWVRVIRSTYGPLEKSVMHQHPAEAVVIDLTDQDMYQVMVDGTTTARSIFKAGSVRWGSTAGVTHQDVNLSNQRLEILRIEIKAASH